jgi:hypothetical protein
MPSFSTKYGYVKCNSVSIVALVLIVSTLTPKKRYEGSVRKTHGGAWSKVVIKDGHGVKGVL